MAPSVATIVLSFVFSLTGARSRQLSSAEAVAAHVITRTVLANAVVLV